MKYARFCQGFMAITMASLLGMATPASSQMPATPKPLGPVATQVPTTTTQGAQETHAMTEEDLSAYMDGIVPQQLMRNDVAGAVVVVVKDGKVLFEKGYGFSDVEKRTPVSPENTLFRPGSISKLFTWTAVMQMQEQGKIDLDRDVNDYLDFKIPSEYSKPITMRNLMTHTGGFEETVKDLLLKSSTTPMSLRDYLSTHIPLRIYPPGTTPAYSNYGAALAGYIVQRVSGMPFNDYVEKYIFGPLEMKDTTFRQPLPASLAPLMSKGYPLASGPAKPFEVITPYPAGSVSTSGADMSHFMLAHLQQGEWNGVRILKPETVQLMHSAQFALDPDLEHMCLGFYEETRNGHRIIGHAGDLEYFHSDLHLIQDANVGFFVSYNSAGRGEISARAILFQSFLDRYFPYTIPPVSPQPNAAADAKLVAGEYSSSRREANTLLSVVWMLSNEKVSPGKNGVINTAGMKSQNQVPKTWEEIGPLLYREKNGQERLGFTRDNTGRMVMSMDFPFEVSMRVGLINSKSFNEFLIGFVAVVCLITFLFWPTTFGMRKHYDHPLMLDRQQKVLRWAIRIVALIDLAYIGSWVALLSGGQPLFDASMDPKLRLMQIIGWLGTIGTIVVIYAIAKTWRSPGEWGLSHAGNVVIALSALSFSWFLYHWHLLHFSLFY